MSFLYLFLAIAAAQAALIPPPPSSIQNSPVSNGPSQLGLSNGFNQVLPAYSGLIPVVVMPSALLPVLPPAPLLDVSPSSNVYKLSAGSGSLQEAIRITSRTTTPTLTIPDGLNPLSLVNISSSAPSTFTNAVVDVFNGINVVFPTSYVPVANILASVTSNANQILPTATKALHTAITSMFPTPSMLSLQNFTSALNSTLNPSNSTITPFSMASPTAATSLAINSTSKGSVMIMSSVACSLTRLAGTGSLAVAKCNTTAPSPLTDLNNVRYGKPCGASAT